LILGQTLEDGEDGRGQHEPGRHANLRPASVEAALARRRVLDGHQHRAAPFAADAEALRHAQHDERDGGPWPDLFIGGQQADQEGRDAHDHERQHEHGLPSDLVPVVADDDAPERPGEESDRVGAEGIERPHQGVGVREEQAVEDEGRSRAVEKEVVPLDRGPNQAGQGDEPYRPVLGLGSRGGHRRSTVTQASALV
jgi:hypothetical protein